MPKHPSSGDRFERHDPIARPGAARTEMTAAEKAAPHARID
jgi:hypothetical protein